VTSCTLRLRSQVRRPSATKAFGAKPVAEPCCAARLPVPTFFQPSWARSLASAGSLASKTTCKTCAAGTLRPRFQASPAAAISSPGSTTICFYSWAPSARCLGSSLAPQPPRSVRATPFTLRAFACPILVAHSTHKPIACARRQALEHLLWPHRRYLHRAGGALAEPLSDDGEGAHASARHLGDVPPQGAVKKKLIHNSARSSTGLRGVIDLMIV